MIRLLAPQAACALLLLLAGGALAASPAKVSVGRVVMTPQPGSKLEAIAREVAAADVQDGGAGALLLIGSQPLGTAGTGPALFVQVQSKRACGSAGCSVSIYLPGPAGWTKVLDAVGTITVEGSQHGGMHDLIVDKADRWEWNGRVYADTLPAPQVDLRPRHAPARPHPSGSHAHHAGPAGAATSPGSPPHP